jgi:FkbM family methyltransferase
LEGGTISGYSYLFSNWSEKPMLWWTSGRTAVSFSLVASHIAGRVIAFEPNPKMVQILRSDIARNGITNIDVHNVGLGSQPGQMTLNVPDRNHGAASFGHKSGSVGVSAIVSTGDAMLAGLSPRLIKIDVEGFEVQCIKGMAETIKRARPVIVTEVDAPSLGGCGSSPVELFDLMEQLGYTGQALELRKRNISITSIAASSINSMRAADVVWMPR